MPSVYMFTELMLWLMNYLSLLNDEKKKSTAKPSRQKHGYESLILTYDKICKMMVKTAAALSKLNAFK